MKRLIAAFALLTMATVCSGASYVVDATHAVKDVPWETLTAGDSVTFACGTYAGKFSINGRGTATSPIVIRGTRCADGSRPVLTGVNAVSRPGMSFGRASASPTNEARAVIMVISTGSEESFNHPAYITIQGLKIMGAHPSYTFKDMSGATKSYSAFDACVWLERGWNLTISDNEITDCGQAVMSRSQDENVQSQTRDVALLNNVFINNGISGNEGSHTTYMQSFGMTYEGNRYGPLRSNAQGNSLKDRSVGSVIRYNRFEGGSYAMDLVEAEDFPISAMADPRYKTTFVYGNVVMKPNGLAIHYGGDHSGNESFYRKGTLYAWNNTFYLQSPTSQWALYMLRFSTTEEHGEFWNNAFMWGPAVNWAAMRSQQDVAAGYTKGGTVNLGVNWAPTRWVDTDADHPVGGTLTGAANMITGLVFPFHDGSLAPLEGGQAATSAQANLAAVAAYPVNRQMDQVTYQVVPRGSTRALGAVETGTAPPTCTDPQPPTPTCSDGSVQPGTWTHGAYPTCGWTFAAGQCPVAPPAHTITITQRAGSGRCVLDGNLPYTTEYIRLPVNGIQLTSTTKIKFTQGETVCNLPSSSQIVVVYR